MIITEKASTFPILSHHRRSKLRQVNPKSSLRSSSEVEKEGGGKGCSSRSGRGDDKGWNGGGWRESHVCWRESCSSSWQMPGEKGFGNISARLGEQTLDERMTGISEATVKLLLPAAEPHPKQSCLRPTLIDLCRRRAAPNVWTVQ